MRLLESVNTNDSQTALTPLSSKIVNSRGKKTHEVRISVWKLDLKICGTSSLKRSGLMAGKEGKFFFLQIVPSSLGGLQWRSGTVPIGAIDRSS